jgi:hypothetical protein
MTSGSRAPAPPAPADDRVLPFTRAVAILVIPFLLVAFGILYVANAYASLLFAWEIKPRITAMLLGSAYLGGVVFFASLLAARQWHRAALGVPAVATFASLLLVTTMLHRDLFLFDRVAGWVWTLIYIIAPPLVVLAYLLNRRRDPGTQPGEALVDRRLVQILLAFGLGAMAFAVALYLVPTLFVDVWPWKLTPLSARVLAPMLCLPGVLAIGIARDRRRSSLRVPLVAQAASLVVMLAALVIRAEDLTGPAASVALAWVLLAGSLGGTVAILVTQREDAGA